MYHMVQTRRDELLREAVEYVAGHGISDLSLRQLAAALGTSHRMLLYHFGSKEALLAEIVREVEARQRALAVAHEPADGLAESLIVAWRHFADPRLAPWERLFFEVYAGALQGQPGMAGVLEGVVDDWLDQLADQLVALGVARKRARTD